MTTIKLRSSAYDLGLFALSLAFAIPLVAYALTGFNMRYSGDDYCYAGLLRQKGFLQTIADTYTGPSPFHGNRISLTLSSGLADLAGPASSALLPTIVLVIWLGGLVLLIRGISKAAGLSAKLVERILAGEILILATLFITPELVQSLYWRSGMFPYLMPLVMYPYIAAIMIGQIRRRQASALSLVGIFVLSLIAGAYSETAVAVQMTLLFAAAVAVILVSRDMNRPAAVVLSVSFIGSLLALMVLAFSPANESRLATLDKVDSLVELIRLTGYHGYLYSRSVLPGQLLPLLAPLVISFWLSAQITGRSGRNVITSWRALLLGFACTGFVVVAIVFAAMFPSAYAQSSYPVGRALILAAFAIAFGSAAVGAILGSFLDTKPRQLRNAALTIAAVGSAVFGVYALVGTISTTNDLARYQRWARFWDERHAEILTERRAGAGVIEVVLIDHIIPDVAELAPDPNFFYNNCAEWYYDIQSLAANQPGWDD